MKLASVHKEDRDWVDKITALRRYYQLVRSGCSPEQTRSDLLLTMEEIDQFDFTVFDEGSAAAPLGVE
jgi:hypothetical protein